MEWCSLKNMLIFSLIILSKEISKAKLKAPCWRSRPAYFQIYPTLWRLSMGILPVSWPRKPHCCENNPKEAFLGGSTSLAKKAVSCPSLLLHCLTLSVISSVTASAAATRDGRRTVPHHPRKRSTKSLSSTFPRCLVCLHWHLDPRERHTAPLCSSGLLKSKGWPHPDRERHYFTIQIPRSSNNNTDIW